jgi:hypothetical protein
MSTDIRGRRSERVLLNVPIAVWFGGATPARAHTVVVNEHGALILAPRPFRAEALLRVVNQQSGREAVCRVAWSGGEDLPGLYKIGIEIMDDTPGFWGDSQSSVAGDAMSAREARVPAR